MSTHDYHSLGEDTCLQDCWTFEILNKVKLTILMKVYSHTNRKIIIHRWEQLKLWGYRVRKVESILHINSKFIIKSIRGMNGINAEWLRYIELFLLPNHGTVCHHQRWMIMGDCLWLFFSSFFLMNKMRWAHFHVIKTENHQVDGGSLKTPSLTCNKWLFPSLKKKISMSRTNKLNAALRMYPTESWKVLEMITLDENY